MGNCGTYSGMQVAGHCMRPASGCNMTKVLLFRSVCTNVAGLDREIRLHLGKVKRKTIFLFTFPRFALILQDENLKQAMNSYQKVINEWYTSLREPFFNFLKKSFPGLTDDDINDIYSDTFVAIHDNLQRGRVEAGTRWKAYIFQIGYNQALTALKHKGRLVRDTTTDEDEDERESGFETLLSLSSLLPDEEDELLRQEKIDVLNREIAALNFPCDTIIRDYYYGRLSMAQIKDEINYKSEDSVKSMKNRCMGRLTERVKAAFERLSA